LLADARKEWMQRSTNMGRIPASLREGNAPSGLRILPTTPEGMPTLRILALNGAVKTAI
jgi:hypothetical protein